MASAPPEGARALGRRLRGLPAAGSASASTVASTILAASFSRAFSASTRVPYVSSVGWGLTSRTQGRAATLRSFEQVV